MNVLHTFIYTQVTFAILRASSIADGGHYDDLRNHVKGFTIDNANSQLALIETRSASSHANAACNSVNVMT